MNSPVSRQPKPLVMVVSLSPNVDFTAPNSCLTPATRHERKHLDKKISRIAPGTEARLSVSLQFLLTERRIGLARSGGHALVKSVRHKADVWLLGRTCTESTTVSEQKRPRFQNANTVPELVLVNRMELHRSRLLRDSRAASRGSAACRACMLSSSTENRHRKFC